MYGVQHLPEIAHLRGEMPPMVTESIFRESSTLTLASQVESFVVRTVSLGGETQEMRGALAVLEAWTWKTKPNVSSRGLRSITVRTNR
jgi:hypothetical protein